MRNTRGWAWTLELGIGLLLLLTLWNTLAVSLTPHSPSALFAHTLCDDFAILYTQNEPIHEWIELYYEEIPIAFISNGTTSNEIIPAKWIRCTAQKTILGITQTITIGIPRE